MNKDIGAVAGTRRTYIAVSLVFVILAVSLQVLLYLYWSRVLDPRLLREASSQANVLAHSQTVMIEDALAETNQRERLRRLNGTVDEILLFTDPETKKPFFLGLDLQIDYDAVAAPAGSLDLRRGVRNCRNCFPVDVPLFSPVSDELMGVAHFRVSDSASRRLRGDIQKTLFAQSHVATLLLFFVWGVVMFLIREVNRSRRRAEMASRAKSSFLANMSHELRTPLSAIIGFSDMMRHDPELLPRHKENIAIINRSGEYLLELINDILELSRIEAAPDTLVETSFDLYSTLENVEEMIRLRAEKKNLQLVFERADDVPRYVKTDERKLRQVLLNLLGNAVKFTDEGGVTMRVRLKKDDRRNSEDGYVFLHFEVEDTGPGIPSEETEKMFEAFAQARSGYDKKEGVGLGLAITRQFVSSLGGAINVNSSVGSGTVFTFTVSAKTATASEIASHQPLRRVIGLKSRDGSDPAHPYRILVVDDNPENRALLRSLLEQAGLLVECAEDGRRAVELDEKWAPDLIWMDIRMPGMDGYEATKRIRRQRDDRQTGQPVIIALTASAFQEDREALLATGCDDFVRRPFRESEIFDKMRIHLGVDYLYEAVADSSVVSPGAATLSAETIRSKIQLLPRKTVEKLVTAIELSDMERMDRAVADIGAEDKELADELRRLLDTFQYDRILAIFENERGEKGPGTGGGK